MAEFINTIDVLGDDAVIDSIIDRTITEFKDDILTAVGEYAFYGCAELTDVDFPNVAAIGEYSFSGCANLKTVKLPGVIDLPRDAFSNCSLLENISAPNVVSFSYNVFGNCISLKSVDFPLVTTERNNYNGAFYKCSALTHVNLPLLTTAGYNFFCGCASLVNVCLPSVKTIGLNSFVDCNSLEILDLPALTNIDGAPFSRSAAMKALILRNNEVCTLTSDHFNSTDPIYNDKCFIYVPRVMVNSYKVATNWSNHADRFRALEDYTVDGTITGELDETKI